MILSHIQFHQEARLPNKFALTFFARSVRVSSSFVDLFESFCRKRFLIQSKTSLQKAPNTTSMQFLLQCCVWFQADASSVNMVTVFSIDVLL